MTCAIGFLLAALDFAAAEMLLSAGHLQFGDALLEICLPPCASKITRSVLVSGIPRATPTFAVKAFFESTRVNGGAVDHLTHECGQETAIVTFQDHKGRVYVVVSIEILMLLTL